eukprot:3838858-Amphidinium_carterae.1
MSIELPEPCILLSSSRSELVQQSCVGPDDQSSEPNNVVCSMVVLSRSFCWRLLTLEPRVLHTPTVSEFHSCDSCSKSVHGTPFALIRHALRDQREGATDVNQSSYWRRFMGKTAE